jgi:hypothetical protein
MIAKTMSGDLPWWAASEKARKKVARAAGRALAAASVDPQVPRLGLELALALGGVVVRQASAMNARGFEVARSAVPAGLCATLRATALRAAREQQRDAASWRTALRQLLGVGGASSSAKRPVRAPKHRVHVQLPLCERVHTLLRAALCPASGLGEAALRAGLSPAARLVELSVMVALPGAEAQAAHTDVPPHTAQRMATLWVALQDVDRTLGPTMIYPSNPSELATLVDWAALQREAEAKSRGSHTVSPAFQRAHTLPTKEISRACICCMRTVVAASNLTLSMSPPPGAAGSRCHHNVQS